MRRTPPYMMQERERELRPAREGRWWGSGGTALGALTTELVRRGVETTETREPESAAGTLGGEALFMRLLPVFDNVTRAQRHAEDGAPSAAVAEGLRMALEQLDEALATRGRRAV